MPATLAKKTSSVSGKRTTRVKPAPDFKKLHQQFLQKLEQGKACTKKPCTVVEAFDLSKNGAKTQFAEIHSNKRTPGKKPIIPEIEIDKENCSPFGKFTGKSVLERDEFQPDTSALASILDNTGITLDTLYPQPQVTRQTVCGNAANTPLQTMVRRQTAATENIRRSIYYTGNSVKPSPNQVFSEYSRHVLSLSQRHTLSNINKGKNLGASPTLKERSLPVGVSPLLQGKQLPRMSLFKRLPNHGTPTNCAPAKRVSPSKSSSVKPKRVLTAKSPGLASPSFKVPNTLPKSAKKPGIKWKDLLNEDMDRLQELEKIEKELESDIEDMEQKVPSAQKAKKMKTSSQLNAMSPLSSKKKAASPRTPKNKSRTEALRNISPMRTPGQQASPKRLPPRSPLVGKQHQASPKRKAEPFPKVIKGVDPSTPPRSKRPFRENDITPKSAGRLNQMRPKQSPLAKTMKGESPIRAILGELSPSVCRRSPKHLNFNSEFDVEDKENCSPEMLEDVQSMRDDDSFFLVEEDDDDEVDILDEAEDQEDENVDELNRTLNQSIAQFEDLEAQANKARRKTEDPEKLMEQLELIQKRQRDLMQMQMQIQEKLMKAQGKKSQQSGVIAAGPLKATHAPTPSKRWRAQLTTEDERKESEHSAELSAGAYSEDSENATPLRKVLFPTSLKREVHFQEEIEVCEITASDVTTLSSESSGTSMCDVSTSSSNVFESPVEVKIYGHTGEINQTWMTQASASIINTRPIATMATIPTETPSKGSLRLGSIQSFSSVKSALPILSPLQVQIPEEECGYPRSDSLLDFAHQHNSFVSHHTTTTTLNSITTPTKSTYCHSPRTPHTPHYTTSPCMSPCNITMSPLTISATEASDTGSLSLSGNLSMCRSPAMKSRSLLDRCLLAQAQHRYEEALADDEVSRYMNRLSAMPRALSPTYRCQEPLSKILEEGDDKHVAPIYKPLEEISQESCFYPIVCPVPSALPQA